MYVRDSPNLGRIRAAFPRFRFCTHCLDYLSTLAPIHKKGVDPTYMAIPDQKLALRYVSRNQHFWLDEIGISILK